MTQPKLMNSNEEFWENRDVRIDKSGLIEAIISWTTDDESRYVRELGTGTLNPGSDLRHSRQWWLKKYLEATDLPELITKRHIRAGRNTARQLLAEIGVKK